MSGIGIFLSKNRRQLVNIVGFVGIFSYSLHTLRVKEALDAKVRVVESVRSRNAAIADTLSSDSWTSSVEAKIKEGEPNALFTALVPLFPTKFVTQGLVSTKDNASKTGVASADGGEAELNDLLSSLSAESQKRMM